MTIRKSPTKKKISEIIDNYLKEGVPSGVALIKYKSLYAQPEKEIAEDSQEEAYSTQKVNDDNQMNQ